MRPFTVSIVATLLFCGIVPEAAQAQSPDFNRDVRPILSQHCFKCHGPDDKQRMAGLRLDMRSGAVGLLASGRRAILAGKPEKSELMRRILLPGGPLQMPPAHTNKPLSPEQKLTLKRWIASGAEYKPHWAFVPPKQGALPRGRQKQWLRNPIDNFVLARLEKEGLRPSPEADRYTLIRRVSLDLIGLPPTPEEADAFVKDRRPEAYERVVDRLLVSPHYGERWARRWLDLARYADTNGYEKDRPRSIWPYRDWVIRALNRDMPFNQFTIEQIAGDMLPNATPEQKIATGFHRNTMLNEEGGIDPQEFRFYSMTDRMATTGTTWLGLTLGCAQCHTHKYDPITHKDYYRMMAFLDNAEEPDMDVPDANIRAKRAEQEQIAARMEANLANNFAIKRDIQWTQERVVSAESQAGITLERLPDGSVRAQGKVPDTDTYTVVVESDLPDVRWIRLEALTDPSLGNGGPGRTPHGNFVLSNLTATIAPHDTPKQNQNLTFAQAEADFTQEGFSPSAVIDGSLKNGWAIHGPGNWNVNRAITLRLKNPTGSLKGNRWTFRLVQNYGGKHTLGKFRISFGQGKAENDPHEAEKARAAAQAAYRIWLAGQEAKAVRWKVLRPTMATSNSPLLTILKDSSVLSSGDLTKRDVYTLNFKTELRGITAIRLEALPDDSLPRSGPGRIYYEGAPGDFFLSEITLNAGKTPVKFAKVTQSSGNAQGTLDGNPQTGWSINGGQGQEHRAIFTLAQPLDASEMTLNLLFEQYYAAGLGRFRISVTDDARTLEANLPADVEEILTTSAGGRTEDQNRRLFQYFLSMTPELAGEREKIRQIRARMPNYPTTLIFNERPANNPRITHIHHRGEFLKTTEQVTPGVLSFLPPLPKNVPANRLTFAQWLVAPTNPLVGRVTVNREWAAFFGRGIVSTTEDFGFQGQPPTHPELLDWLATHFVTNGRWSLKSLHRLIVTSATYRQASQITPTLKARDPQNRLLARGPRVRLDAELLRDSALTLSGLLSRKIGGPGVFPPQPPGVTSEGTYGPLQWQVSEGEDRYRRGLYTFSKRTAPYAMFTTFDAPSGEACLARREVSNTPLQALTMLNDAVFIETAQALGRRLTERAGSIEEKTAYLFRLCVVRPPDRDELTALLRFYESQKKRLEAGELDANALAGMGTGDRIERAAWTTLARSLLNLDEVIVKR